MVVADSSVIGKWFPPMDTEPLAAEARSWFDRWQVGDVEIVAPDFLYAELGNILWKSVRSTRCDRHQAETVLRSMTEMELAVFPSADLVDTGLRIAITHGRAIYDCLYVALALKTKADLLTADEKLANALRAHYPIRWLGDI